MSTCWIAGILGLSLALAGCGAEGGEGASVSGSPAQSQTVEEALGDLPEDTGARASELERLSQTYPEHPGVQAAIAQHVGDSTVGFLKRVEFDQGRSLIFSEQDGAVMLLETGPKEVGSKLEELGLHNSNLAEIWEAVVPDEPVPQAVVQASIEPSTFDGVQLDEGPDGDATEEEYETDAVFPDIIPDQLRDEGTVEKAFNSTQFINAGGCAIKTSPNSGDIPQVPHSPMCVTDVTGALTAQLTSKQFRLRITSQRGSVLATILNNGVVRTNPVVGEGAWINALFVNPSFCRSRCCGPLGSCFKRCTRCGLVATSAWRVEVTQAAGDLYHAGGIWTNITDTTPDTQPWN